MVYKTFAEMNQSEGIQVIFSYVSEIEPLFTPILLFVIFFISAIGSYFLERNFTGRGNLLGSLATGGFVTTVIAYVMSLIPNFINTITVIICLIITIVFVLLFLITKEKR